MKQLQPLHLKTVKEKFAEQRKRQQKEQKTFTKNIEKLLILFLFISFCIGLFFV